VSVPLLTVEESAQAVPFGFGFAELIEQFSLLVQRSASELLFIFFHFLDHSIKVFRKQTD
jgi:hypothetical protein